VGGVYPQARLGGEQTGDAPDSLRGMDATTLPDRPFTLADLADLGLTRKRLRTRIEHGHVRRVLRGVFVSASVEDDIELRAAALALAVAPGHVIVDRAAAWLHGVDTYSRTETELGAPIETCALRGRHPSHRPGADGRTRDLSAADIMTIAGLRVTTPERTALDLACHLRRREAYAAVCMLARVHGLSPGLLAAMLPRYAGRRGVVQARELVGLMDPRFESEREAWVFLAIHDAGLPHPEPQVWVDRDGVPTYRLDLAYPAHHVYVEYDGADAHDRKPGQRERDERRRAWLRAQGWTVIVIKLGDFTGAALDAWLRQLREALREATYSTRRW